MIRRLFLVAFVVLLAAFSGRAWALISGSTGNAPTFDPGWPVGALELANQPNRLGYWEGPPFGGGEYHFLYRGETGEFQAALDQFAKIRAPELRVVVREGTEESFWLKNDAAGGNPQVDWTLVLWTPRSFHALYNNPRGYFESGDPSGLFRNAVPPPTLEVNVAGADGKGIDWSKIKVPAGVKVVDERATAEGYARVDGAVVRGDVYDLMSSKPVAGAQISVLKSQSKKEEDVAAQGKSDATGHFEIKHLAPGYYLVNVAAAGYVTRSMGGQQYRQNTLRNQVVQLALPITIAGTVKDTGGRALAGVKIRSESVMALDGRGYLLSDEPTATTDAQGYFELSGLPEGYFELWASDGIHQQLEHARLFGPPSNGMPAKRYDDVAITMTGTGTIKGKVFTKDGRPATSGNVSVRGASDNATTWGGGGTVQPDGSFQFSQVPPGHYYLSTSAPNPLAAPGADAGAVQTDVKIGETNEVQLTQQ